MIKTSVNLYSDNLLPIQQRLTLTRLMSVLGLFVVIFIVLYGVVMWQQQQLQAKQQQASHDNVQLNDQKIALEAQIAARKPDSALVAQVELEEQRLELKIRLKDELSQRQNLISKGYSPMLTDLASVADANVWLSHISIVQQDNGPQRVEFEGYGRNPQSVPLWIDKLKNTETLKGYAFSAMTMDRGDDQPLMFKLTSQISDKEPSQ
ncbi:fimbrial assembly protein [Shewanella inventionis]|uniref:MSHA biogenesis protein MshI2 n=1 Tax=Shewanella inventionis TaxID=1738770 RepID=A0ABQ1J931_9GAMM|nr:PilN domain-containing protein [Shewanella inventionis]MCL1158002.1 fimbrial assembly protein [Shewanella inventionis]UAL44056.1 fimbrial assembly protein [Shewanella inventionis]GGB62860.1 MSHA biogenesis protein MshI2 [Shewanella inventionis]